ncbi:2OG-Fe(II) oxygenase [Prauserella endophytica]
MEGNTEEPPTQWAHKDEAQGRNPVATSLYYAEVENATGGALALHDSAGQVRTRVHPGADQLVIIAGDQVHSVEPLTAGNRITVVTNFYRT